MMNTATKLVLLVTNERDITTDFVVLELERRHVPYLRLNTENISDATVSFRPHSATWLLKTDKFDLSLSDVSRAYFRRPGNPLNDRAGAMEEYRRREWSSLLWSFYSALEGRWLNSPRAIERAEDKPMQQALAAKVGFLLPETLVTNDFDQAQRFVATGLTVAKPLRSALIDDSIDGSVIFTNRVLELEARDEPAIKASPVIFQREIIKRRDLRVTIVGKRVFATAIDSQIHTETQTDWRRGSFVDLPHTPVDLPESVVSQCHSLLSALDLRFGAIDLVEGEDGRLWFLEINPNGQWAWIERRTGYGISAAIVDELVL